MSAVHRLTWVVDIEGYGRRDHSTHTELQQRLQWVLTQTLKLAGVNPGSCDRQERGDGVLLILPPAIKQDKVLPVLLTGLRDVLREANRVPRTAGRIRLRSALAQGVVERGETGFKGQSVILACYLLDAPAVKAALAGATDSDLVTVVSDDLHRDVFRQGFAQASFRSFELARPEKGFAATGWLHLSGPGRVDPRVPAYAPPVQDRRTSEERRADSVFSLLLSFSSGISVVEAGYELSIGLQQSSSSSTSSSSSSHEHEHDCDDYDDHDDDDEHDGPADSWSGSDTSSSYQGNQGHHGGGNHGHHDHDDHYGHGDDWHH